MTLDEFKTAIEYVLADYLWEKLNEDTETKIINDISDLIEENQFICPDDFQIDFNNDEPHVLKVKVTLPNAILNYEVRG